MKIEMLLSDRESAVIEELNRRSIGPEEVMKIAVNRLIDELVNNDGELDRRYVVGARDYLRMVRRHQGGPGAVLHSQRVENELIGATPVRAFI